MTAPKPAKRTILLTIAEAAEEMRISETSMRQLINRGDILTVTPMGNDRGARRITRKDLEAFVERLRVAS